MQKQKLLNLYELQESLNVTYNEKLLLEMVEQENSPRGKYLLLASLYDQTKDINIYLNEYKELIKGDKK